MKRVGSGLLCVVVVSRAEAWGDGVLPLARLAGAVALFFVSVRLLWLALGVRFANGFVTLEAMEDHRFVETVRRRCRPDNSKQQRARNRVLIGLPCWWPRPDCSVS